MVKICKIYLFCFKLSELSCNWMIFAGGIRACCCQISNGVKSLLIQLSRLSSSSFTDINYISKAALGSLNVSFLGILNTALRFESPLGEMPYQFLIPGVISSAQSVSKANSWLKNDLVQPSSNLSLVLTSLSTIICLFIFVIVGEIKPLRFMDPSGQFNMFIWKLKFGFYFTFKFGSTRFVVTGEFIKTGLSVYLLVRPNELSCYIVSEVEFN